MISIENLKNEDHSFCKHFWDLGKSDLSSWNGETAKVNRNPDLVNVKKKKFKRKEKKKALKFGDSAGTDLENNTNCAMNSGGTGMHSLNIEDSLVKCVDSGKGFKQLGFSSLQPVFCPDKYQVGGRSYKNRSMSLEHSQPDPDFSHFGCSVPRKPEEKTKAKDKVNVYTSSYYNKFFIDTNSCERSEQSRNSLKKSLNFNKNHAKTVKLPSLRQRLSVNSGLYNCADGKGVFNFS